MGKELKGMSSMVRRTTFLYGSGGGGGGESSKDMGLSWRGGTDNNFALTVTVCTSRRIESSVIIGRV